MELIIKWGRGANAACMLERLPIDSRVETCFGQGALMLNDADLRTLTINGSCVGDYKLVLYHVCVGTVPLPRRP